LQNLKNLCNDAPTFLLMGSLRRCEKAVVGWKVSAFWNMSASLPYRLNCDEFGIRVVVRRKFDMGEAI